jgi:hypothetical protein
MKPSPLSYLAGSAQAHLVRSRWIRAQAIAHAFEQLIRVYSESQQPGVSSELAPSLLIGELEWASALHELLYDWRTDDAEYYIQAFTQHNPAELREYA